ncbi:hypothetical protein COOONC_25515 [Cooperia oncophora]
MQSRRNIPCPIAMGNPDPELVERVTRREREREARRKAKDNERVCLLLGRELPPSRLGNQQWCSCGSCKSFTRIRENFLSRSTGRRTGHGSVERATRKVERRQHPSFQVVLDPETLRVLLVNLRMERKKAKAPVEDENRRDSFRRGGCKSGMCAVQVPSLLAPTAHLWRGVMDALDSGGDMSSRPAYGGLLWTLSSSSTGVYTGFKVIFCCCPPQAVVFG